MKALIVVDMQNDFVTGSLKNNEAQRILPNVKAKIAKELKSGTDLYFTMDTHSDDYLDTEEGKNLPILHCIGGTSGWSLVDGILPDSQKDRVFTKDAFGSTTLGWDLQEKQYDEVELIGVCTDICVISNALLIKAFLPNAHIIIDASCCAGVTQKSHKTALQAMKACQIEIINE